MLGPNNPKIKEGLKKTITRAERREIWVKRKDGD